jgi:hypothetical protein
MQACSPCCWTTFNHGVHVFSSHTHVNVHQGGLMGCDCRVCVCGCVHQYIFVETLSLLSATQGQPSVVGLLPTNTASTPSPECPLRPTAHLKGALLGVQANVVSRVQFKHIQRMFCSPFKIARTPSQACAADQQPSKHAGRRKNEREMRDTLGSHPQTPA